MNISREFLYRSGSNPGAIDEGDYEFAEYICESMVSLGSSNLQSIAGDSTVLPLYLEQVIRLCINIFVSILGNGRFQLQEFEIRTSSNQLEILLELIVGHIN